MNHKQKPPEIAKSLMNETHFIYYAGQLYYYYNGVYKPNADLLIKKRTQKALGTDYSKYNGNEVVHYIEVIKNIGLQDVRLPSHLINLKNGIFDLEKGKLLPHDPSIISICQVPIAYDGNAVCPNIDNFLSSTLPSDCIQLIEKYLATV